MVKYSIKGVRDTSSRCSLGKLIALSTVTIGLDVSGSTLLKMSTCEKSVTFEKSEKRWCFRKVGSLIAIIDGLLLVSFL